jgi:hypothetical protein
MPTPEIKRVNANLTLGSMEAIALVYFPSKNPSTQEVAAMRAHLIETDHRSPGGFGLVLLLPEAAGPPEGEAREMATQMFRAVKGRLKVMAAVLEGSGFAAAAKRSVLTVLVNVAIGSARLKVVSDVVSGCHWMAHQAKVAALSCPTSADLQALLERMRAGE